MGSKAKTTLSECAASKTRRQHRKGGTMNRTLRRYVGLWLLLFAVVALAVGHGVGLAGALAADESRSPAPATDKVVLKIGWLAEPDNLNPFIGYDDAAYEVWSLQYDYLFAEHPDGSHSPELAVERPTVENGGVSPDGKVWTVKIRPDVMWQDGKPLTAEDVAFSFNYIIEGGLWNFTMVTAGIDHVEVVDPTTVKIVCLKPKADMVYASVPIIPKHIWGDVKPWAAQNSYQSKPPIVGSGPFQVVAFKKSDYVKMVRNPSYWGEEPAIDEIVFETYTNADTMTQELKMGTIDGAEGIPKAQFSGLKEDDAFGTSEWNVTLFDYMTLNCMEGPSLGNPILRDREFRRALCQAIDHQALVDIAWSGMGDPGTTIINPDTWTDPDFHWQPSPEQELAFDLEKAKQTLEAAGYKDGNGDGIREDKDGEPIKIRLWAAAESPQDQSEGKLIAGWWKEIGVDVNYEILDFGTIDDNFWNYEGDTYTPNYDAYIASTLGYADPGATVPWFTTEQIENWNEPCWSNAEYDKLSTEQVSVMDPQQRAEMIWRMQEVMYEDAVYPVLVYPRNLQAYNTDKWEGWTPLGFGGSDGPGPVFYTSYNTETYLNLKPTGESAGESGGSSSTATVVTIVVVAVIVAGVVVWLVVRRRSGRKETADEA